MKIILFIRTIDGIIFYFCNQNNYMEISDFLRKRKPIPPLPTEYEENAEWEEERLFNAWIKKYPAEEHTDIKERLQYIRKYVLSYPDFDGEEWFPSQAAINYYELRQERLEYCKLSEAVFYSLQEMQKSIKELGLQPKPTFEFIVYLWNILKRWWEQGDVELVAERIKRLFSLIEKQPDEHLKLDISVGRKHIKFENDRFIKSLFAVILNSDVEGLNSVETVKPDKLEIDYILIKTLLDNLPIKYAKEKKGKYTKAERIFSLSVLWLTGEIAHGKNDSPLDTETFNNGTFDLLMRRYKDMPLPAVFALH